MSPEFHASARHWITGLLLALLGIALNRIAAPAFEGAPRSCFALAGQLMGVAGLLVIALGIRRRIQRAATDACCPPSDSAAPGPR